jgi:hypothetical protein
MQTETVVPVIINKQETSKIIVKEVRSHDRITKKRRLEQNGTNTRYPMARVQIKTIVILTNIATIFNHCDVRVRGGDKLACHQNRECGCFLIRSAFMRQDVFTHSITMPSTLELSCGTESE